MQYRSLSTFSATIDQDLVTESVKCGAKVQQFQQSHVLIDGTCESIIEISISGWLPQKVKNVGYIIEHDNDKEF